MFVCLCVCFLYVYVSVQVYVCASVLRSANFPECHAMMELVMNLKLPVAHCKSTIILILANLSLHLSLCVWLH